MLQIAMLRNCRDHAHRSPPPRPRHRAGYRRDMMSLPHLISSIVTILRLAFLPAAMRHEGSEIEDPPLFGHLEFRVAGPDGMPIPARRTAMSSAVDLAVLTQTPLADLLQAPLRAGANRVVIAVENGTRDFGFHFRPLSREVEIRTTPDEQAAP